MLSQIFLMSLEQMTMVSQMQAHVTRGTVEVSCALDIHVYVTVKPFNDEVNLKL